MIKTVKSGLVTKSSLVPWLVCAKDYQPNNQLDCPHASLAVLNISQKPWVSYISCLRPKQSTAPAPEGTGIVVTISNTLCQTACYLKPFSAAIFTQVRMGALPSSPIDQQKVCEWCKHSPLFACRTVLCPSLAMIDANTFPHLYENLPWLVQPLLLYLLSGYITWRADDRSRSGMGASEKWWQWQQQ
jgi:hypothetical protein